MPDARSTARPSFNRWRQIIIAYFSVHAKMCIITHAPSRKLQITVRYWGDSTLFRILSKELAACQPSDAWNLEVAPRFLENLWTRGVKYIFECFVQFLFAPINVSERCTRCSCRHACVSSIPACDSSKISVLTALGEPSNIFFCIGCQVAACGQSEL
jgi:hypothetical protein